MIVSPPLTAPRKRPSPPSALAAFTESWELMTLEPIDFGAPRRMRTLPRSVSAPRRKRLSPTLPRGKSSSAFWARRSNRSRKAFLAVFW